MLRVLDAVAVRAWCEAGRALLVETRAETDALNVFPVPDGDTGTNLLLTLDGVCQAVRVAADALPATAAAVADGALLAARGNSGVLLAQLLRGLADELRAGPLDGPGLARGLVRAAVLAREATGSPVEGTLLTVAADAADAATRAADLPGASLADVVRAARTAADASLARTPELLPALRAAGVVDAGGRGWSLLLGALEGVVTGRPVPVAAQPAPGQVRGCDATPGEAYGYEVQYLLHGAAPDAVDRLRARLSGLGGSLVLVGGNGLHTVHVHVDDVGAAVEAGVEAGRPSRITVERFADRRVGAGRAVLAMATGDGPVALLRAAGATVVPGGSSAAELAAAVRATGAPEVLVLPDTPAARAVAEAAVAGASGVRVGVVGSSSVLQAIAALAVADPDRPLAEQVDALTAVAASVRTGRLVRAAAAATTSAGMCVPGDLLAVVDGAVVLVGAEPEWVARSLVDRLAGGAELITLAPGTGAPEGLAERLRADLRQRHPAAEVVLVEGGHPYALLLVGAE